MAKHKKIDGVEYWTFHSFESYIPLATMSNLRIIGIIKFIKFYMTELYFRLSLHQEMRLAWTRFRHWLQRPAFQDIESFESESLTENIAKRCEVHYAIRPASSDSLFVGEKWILSIYCKKHEAMKYYDLINKHYRTIIMRKTNDNTI